MPPPPAGCAWKFEMNEQRWSSYATDGSNKKCSDLKDGNKYLLGIK